MGVERRRERARKPTPDPLRTDWPVSHQDDLTGVHGRRVLTELLEARWSEVVAFHGTLALILVDLDFFKDVNDTYGHPTGDDVLRETAQLLRAHFRDEDLVVRYGGDEFVVLLPGAGRTEAVQLAQRVRKLIGSHAFVSREGEPIRVPVSFSMGVASYPDDGSDGEDGQGLLEAADRRLYADKRERRGGSTRPVTVEVPVSGRRTVALLAATVAIAAAVALVTVRLTAPDRPAETGSDDRPSATRPDAPPAPEPTATPTPSGMDPGAPGGVSPAQAADAERQRLEDQIRRLEQQVASLSASLASEASAGQRADSETTIRQLQQRIQVLEEQQARPAPPDPDQERSRPQVRASQPAPLAPTPRTARQSPAQPPPPITTQPVLVRLGVRRYPPLAERARREGTVQLRVVVDAGGRVVSADPVGERLGLGLEEAARDAVMGATYRPGTRDGEPVTMATVVAVQFTLAR